MMISSNNEMIMIMKIIIISKIMAYEIIMKMMIIYNERKNEKW